MLIKKVFKLKNLRYVFFLFIYSCIENAPLDSLSPEGPYARSIDELFCEQQNSVVSNNKINYNSILSFYYYYHYY